MTSIKCTYTSNFSEILRALRINLILTSHQAGGIIIISPSEIQNQLRILYRKFPRVMGIAKNGNQLCLSTKEDIFIFTDKPQLLPYYKENNRGFDHLYVPFAQYYTNHLDTHDLVFSGKGIFFANTMFSCICKISTQNNFIPIWKPFFVSEIEAGDRCHLNGLAEVDGLPRFATALGKSDVSMGWKDNMFQGGVLLDIESNKVILDNLAIPHSPRVYKDDLYLLTSADGELIKVDSDKKTCVTISKHNCFVRGLDFYKDLAFVGYSKIRNNRKGLFESANKKVDNKCGVGIVDVKTGGILAEVFFDELIEELFDVRVEENAFSTNILNRDNEKISEFVFSSNGIFKKREKKDN